MRMMVVPSLGQGVNSAEEGGSTPILVPLHLCVDSTWHRRVKPRIDAAPGYQQDATEPSKCSDIGIGRGT
jgi:hypothetical protein